MSGKLLMALCTLLVLTAAARPDAAAAQTVAVPNALIVYFDEGATIRSWYGTGPVTAYIVVGPLSAWDGQADVPSLQLERWSGRISLEPLAGNATATVMPRGGVVPAVVDLANGWADLEVTLPTPLPLQGRTVVADLALMVTSALPTVICLEGWQFQADGRTGSFTMLTDGPDGQMDMTCRVAGINTAAPVAATATCWSAVKAMFR